MSLSVGPRSTSRATGSPSGLSCFPPPSSDSSARRSPRRLAEVFRTVARNSLILFGPPPSHDPVTSCRSCSSRHEISRFSRRLGARGRKRSGHDSRAGEVGRRSCRLACRQRLDVDRAVPFDMNVELAMAEDGLQANAPRADKRYGVLRVVHPFLLSSSKLGPSAQPEGRI